MSKELFYLTANDLRHGAIVYWSDEKKWTKDFGQAKMISSPDELADLEEKIDEPDTHIKVVGPYFVKVVLDDQGNVTKTSPVKLRERHRVAGPSVNFSQSGSASVEAH